MKHIVTALIPFEHGGEALITHKCEQPWPYDAKVEVQLVSSSGARGHYNDRAQDARERERE